MAFVLVYLTGLRVSNLIFFFSVKRLFFRRKDGNFYNKKRFNPVRIILREQGRGILNNHKERFKPLSKGKKVAKKIL